MRFSKILIAFFATALCLKVSASAAAEATKPNSLGVHLEQIDVLATEAPKTGEVQHSEFTGSFTHITHDKLQREELGVGEILAHENGVQHRQTGGFGSFSTITLRAGSSAQTGIYLDGILLNSGGAPVVDLSTLAMLSIHSVDIYRGTSPLQLSHGAMAGAVNLRTFAPSANNTQKGSLSLGVGSFSNTHVKASYQKSVGRWQFASSLSHQNSENNFTFVNNNGTPLNALDDQKERRNNAQANSLSGLLKVAYQWHPESSTTLLIQSNKKKQGVPEWRNNANNSAFYSTHSTQLQLSQQWDNVADWNTQLTFFQHQLSDHFSDTKSQIGLGAQDNTSDINTLGMKSYWERILDIGTLAFSTEYRNETLHNNDRLDSSNTYSAKRNQLNANLQLAAFINNESILITPTLRTQTVDDSYTHEVRDKNANRTKTQFTPQLGLRFQPNEQWQWHTNVGRHHREPSFYELFGSQGLINGNVTLEAEFGINADAGFVFTPHARYSLSGNLFSNWRQELISTVFDSRGVGRSINAGKAHILGLELSQQWQLSETMSTSMNITLQNALNKSDSRILYNKQLPNEAQTALYLRLQRKAGSLRYWYEFDGVGKRFYDQSNLLPAKKRLLHNIGVDWQKQALKFSLSASNISNTQAEDFNGFPRPGRAYFLSASYTFQ